MKRALLTVTMLAFITLSDVWAGPWRRTSPKEAGMDPKGLEAALDFAIRFDKKGDYEPLLFEPGTKWSYSDGGPNWLAECLTLTYRRDLQEVLFERVFTPIGITHEDLVWRKNAYRPELIEGIPRREFSGTS